MDDTTFIITLISEEVARLKYDRQIIQSLSKKMADEEQEIEALRCSNFKATKPLALVLKRYFFDSYTSLAALDKNDSNSLIELLVNYPELLKDNENELISCLYIMPIYSQDNSFLKDVKKVLLTDAMAAFCISSQDRFVKLHLEDIWKSLISLNFASKKEYNEFKKKSQI